MTREYIADKQTLDIVYANVGASTNTASATPKTLFEGLKHLLANWTADRAAKIDSINTNAARLTATRAGYIDKINSGVAVANLNGKIVKSVQRGTISVPQSGENSVTIKAVDLNKSILITSNASGDRESIGRAWLASSTTIRATTGYNYGGSVINWTVIEFY